MNDLIDVIDKVARVSTFKIWEDFDYSEHRTLKALIFKNKESFLEFGNLLKNNKIISTAGNTTNLSKPRPAGRPETGFLLNQSQCMLLMAMVKPTKKANVLKVRLIKEFDRRGEELKRLSQPSAHIQEIRKILLLDAPSTWVKLFHDDFYSALMKLYGMEFTSNKRTPRFCSAITRKWIYDIVLPVELQEEIDEKINKEKRHQWFTENNGRATLLNQINQVTGIAKMSRDRKQFEANCEVAFNDAPLQLSVFI